MSAINGNVYDSLNIDQVIELVVGYAKTRLIAPLNLLQKLQELESLEVISLNEVNQ
jgi:hypothetical protein